ncbi:MAG: RNA polymerase sigma factor [Bacteroidales bacterium]|jgi:RNA polymerase sigma factor (sigma-70 family)
MNEKDLIQKSLSGDKTALEKLIIKYRAYIYNIAWKMVLNRKDAEDITQEVLIKAITNLSKFKFESNFKTWLYRITANHFLDMKKSPMEYAITSFNDYADALRNIPDDNLSEIEQIEKAEFIEDAKIGCISGMLLCLNRKERIIYILAEIFQTDYKLSAQMLEMSYDNFRQCLTRARKNLHSFMNSNCGLINKQNTCRCYKKTKGFIELGWVNPHNLQFNVSHKRRIYQLSKRKAAQFNEILDKEYSSLYLDCPFVEDFDKGSIIESVLKNKNIKEIFDLN